MSRYLAIDIDSHGLYVASGSAHRGKTAIEKVAFAPIEGPPLSPGTAVALGRQLKDLLKHAGLSAAPVLLCLGRDKIILKDVVHPKTTGPEEPVIVRFQAVKDLTNDADEMELDYVPTGETTDGQRTALAVFARKDAVQAAKMFCEAAGLKLQGLTPRPFAATAAAQAAVATGAAEPTDDPADPVAVLTLSDSGGEFTAAKAGRVLFTRMLPVQSVQSEAALVSEVRRNLAVFSGLGGGEPARAVYVAESGPPESGWTFRLAAGLPVPVHRFDPLAGTAIGEEVPVASRGGFVGAVGLLALAAAGPALPINFISPRQPKAEPNKSRARLIVAALAAMLLLTIGGIFGYYVLDGKDKELAQLTNEDKALDIAIKSSEENENRLNAAEEFQHQTISIPDELYELSYKFPDIERMKLSEISFELMKLPNEKERERIAKDLKAKPMTAARKKQLEANPQPTGSFKFTVTTSDTRQADSLVKAFVGDSKYYQKPLKTGGATGSGAGGGGRGRAAPYYITTKVAPRKPGEYRHKLKVTGPVVPAAAPGFDNATGDPLGDFDDPNREEN
ncbi:MAG TPA: pilus assembly protein PilM [Fimbriiglobus sp.]